LLKESERGYCFTCGTIARIASEEERLAGVTLVESQ